MPEYQYSNELQQYTTEYQQYLAVRDMCTIMVALHRQDYDTAANVWNRHEGLHYHIAIHAISGFIDYFLRKGEDPAAWARDFDAYAGGEDISVRDMCKMMIALHDKDRDAALDVWNEHEGAHFRLATEAINGLRSYLVRDGRDPIDWASSYEAYGAKQAGCLPSLGGKKASMSENYAIWNDQPEGLTDLAIAATAKNLSIATTRNDWNFCAGDDTSHGHPYVEHHLTPGRLWLRVTGGHYDENQQPGVWCRIWCPQVLGGDASVPMERFALEGLQMLIGQPADARRDPRTVKSTAPTGTRVDAQHPLWAGMRGKWGWAAAVSVFLVSLIAGGLASALLIGGAAILTVGIVAGIRSVRENADGRHRRTALIAVSAGTVSALGGVLMSPAQIMPGSNLPLVTTSAPATTPSLAPSPTSDPTRSLRSTVDGKPDAQAKNKGSSASFKHFKVTVTQVRRNTSQVLLQAKVCVKSLPPDPQGNRTRISWDPWSIRAGSRTIEPDLQALQLGDEFPADATYRVGQCAAGWIPFATNRRVTRIVYANGVGDRAVWDAANLAAQPTLRRG